MCGRYLIITEDEIIEMKSILEELNQRFSNLDDFSFPKADSSGLMEIAPGAITPVLILKDNTLQMQTMKWGFSRWDEKGSIINARAESVGEKSFFKDAFANNRCIIPSRGFFEWKKSELSASSSLDSSPDSQLLSPHSQLDFGSVFGLSDIKNSPPPKYKVQSEKYWIKKSDSPLFLMAGIYQEKDGGYEFTILTMPANLVTAEVHDRMPVYLDKPRLLTWLQNPDILKELISNGALDTSFVLTQLGARN